VNAQSTDEQFNAAYEETGLIESDIDPVLLRKIFDYGYACGYAAGYELGKAHRPKLEPVPGNGAEAPRVWRKKGTVKPDDPRPASEKQIAFVAKLFKKAKINPNVAGNELVSLCNKVKPFIGCIVGEPMPQNYTTGQASQLIDLLLKWPV